jgi:hypothetical protein
MSYEYLTDHQGHAQLDRQPREKDTVTTVGGESGKHAGYESEDNHEDADEERTLELLRQSVLEMSFNRIDGPEDLYVGG